MYPNRGIYSMLHSNAQTPIIESLPSTLHNHAQTNAKNEARGVSEFYPYLRAMDEHEVDIPSQWTESELITS